MTLETIAQYIGYLVTIGGFILFLCKMWGKVKDIAEGQKCQLRSQITSTYYTHCDEEEPTMREYERENLDAAYEAYIALRGNTYVHDIYEEMRHWHVSR